MKPICPICQDNLKGEKPNKDYYYYTGCLAQCTRLCIDNRNKEIVAYYLQMTIDDKVYQFNSQLGNRKGWRERSWLSIYKLETPPDHPFKGYAYHTMMEFDKHTPLEGIDNPERHFRRLINLRIFA